VSYGDLRDRAAAMGVEVTYWDWNGCQTIVGDDTLAAIVGALGDVPPAGRAEPTGTGVLDAVAPLPERRSWGFAVQLYSVRSRGSWPAGRPATWARTSSSSTRCTRPSRCHRSARRRTSP
jgi:hypothetical protein